MSPKARREPHAITTHGDTRIDNYYWLRDDSRSRPEVLDYLHQENDYGRKVMASQQALQDRLLAEMVERIPQRDISAPGPKMAIAIAISTSPATNTRCINASLP
jgi:oligopeptidase B